MNLLAELYSSAWAIRPEALAAMIAYIERDDMTPAELAAAFHFDKAAIEAALESNGGRYAVHQRDSTRVDGAHALYRRGSTAILPITGPIVRRGNLMASMSGGPLTSVEMLSRDFTRAVEDDAFASVLLDVDSPGGEASGVGELAQMILEARSEKPIWAYVSDLGASAGYWLSSAADQLIIAPTASVGSIGVVMAVRDPSATKRTQVEFVSSQSPHKRSDPTTESGKAQFQTFVDSLGSLFVDAVARHRGTTTETVLKEFGAGGLLVGADAVEHGMADRLGSLEGTLRELAEHTRPQPRALRRPAAALPAAATVESALEERAPLPADATPASTELTTAHTGLKGAAMSLRDKFNTWLDSMDGGAVDASADQEATIVASNAATPPPAARSQLPAPAQTAPIAIIGDADVAIRNRNAALEAENARLRAANITQAAERFADGQVAQLKAMPPEKATLIQLFAVLAQDDERHGPLLLADGSSVQRVSYLENLMAARISRKDLTDDVLGSAVTQVLVQREEATRRANADEPDAARLASLLAATPAGQRALANAATNGRAN